MRLSSKFKLRRAGVVEVGVKETERLIRDDGALVVDVREEQEYHSGRIPEARHIPIRQLGDRLDDLEPERDRPIIVACRSGRRSAYASIYLCSNGFSKVYNLRGGIRAWARARRQIER